MPTDHSSSDGSGQRQCRRRGGDAARVVDVELHAAMALADMAGAVGQPARPVRQQQQQQQPARPVRQQHALAAQQEQEQEEEELASTRLSLELGNVGIHSSPCSSSSSGAAQPAAAQQLAGAAAAPGYGPKPRHMLTEAEKEAKRLRRVLANRESARQTILRRQAIREELARKVADLASQNETMKKEKDMVLEQYISLKETNKQLKEQLAKTTSKKKPSPARSATNTAMDIAPQQPAAQLHAAAEASPLPTPPQPSFLYSAAPYVWGSWPPCGAGYEHGGSPAGAPPLCLPPGCAWYYPVVAAAADPHGSPSSYVQPFQHPRAAAGEQPTSGGGSSGGEDTDDDPCSLTLAIDADKKSAAAAGTAGANAYPITSSPAAGVGLQVALTGREKAATAAEARKRRKELTKLKQMHAGGRHGTAGEQW